VPIYIVRCSNYRKYKTSRSANINFFIRTHPTQRSFWLIWWINFFTLLRAKRQFRDEALAIAQLMAWSYIFMKQWQNDEYGGEAEEARRKSRSNAILSITDLTWNRGSAVSAARQKYELRHSPVMWHAITFPIRTFLYWTWRNCTLKLCVYVRGLDSKDRPWNITN
jgi:hypothetical protein